MAVQYSEKRAELPCGDRRLPLGKRTYVMAILNVTPDSFSDGGRAARVEDAVAHAERLLEEGADVIDIGGESTRPGAEPVAVEEELRRVLPVVEALVARNIRNLSIDTRNARTATEALACGASWLNDVSALTHDAGMVEAARMAEVVVLMHARGTPKTMQSVPIAYADVVEEVRSHLAARVAHASSSGLSAGRILVDPGIGFGKRLEDNLALTRQLDAFSGIAAGVLYGPSRKRFLGELTGIPEADQRDAATLGAVCVAAGQGADLVRVHEVKRTVQALRVVDALRGPSS